MSEEMPDRVLVTQKPTGRVSGRATVWHLSATCRQVDVVTDISAAEANRRGLKPCSYCTGEVEYGPYGTIAKGIRGMDDDERQALADKITTDD